MTPRGHRLLKGEESVRLRTDSLGRAAGARSKATRAPEPVGDPAALDLLQRLKETRLALARERCVPPYVIFHDATLIELASRRPTSRDEFAEIHGVGASKLRNFADTFLAAIAGHTAGQG